VVVEHLDEPSGAEPYGFTDFSDGLIVRSHVERRQCVLDRCRLLGRLVQPPEQFRLKDPKPCLS
jgi:hypothetical protein